MADIGKDIEKAQKLLEEGSVVAIPTETVYGLAANALNPEAVIQIFKIKQRPAFDPLIIHTNDLEKIHEYVTNIPDKAYLLAEAFWPGPLTILLEKRANIPDIVTSGLNRVAIRIPDHALSLALLDKLSFPLAAPSANPFGYISPTTAYHVNDQLGSSIQYILDGGPCAVGIESTIVGFEGDIPFIYRLGGMSLEQIQDILGTVTAKAHSTSNPSAPGMLQSHYAPKKPVIIGNIDSLIQQYKGKNFAILSFNKTIEQGFTARQIDLSKTGSLEEAAKNLFTALRTLDKLPVDLILTDYLPDEGLGKAINDRLKRAAAK
jgi:L-threonylcarbamoyladenylate synthase